MMGLCNVNALYGGGQLVKSLLPFLASITLTYSSKCLYVFLTDGHHTDSHAVLLRMLQCAAFVAPAFMLLAQLISYGYVLLIGTCLTTLGAAVPFFIADVCTQEVLFAVLYGSGTSIIFQATLTSVSAVFRTNVAGSLLTLGLTAVFMATTQQIMDAAIVTFPQQIRLGLLAFLSLMCLIPAFVDVLHTGKLHINEKPQSGREDSDSDTLNTSLTVNRPSSTVNTNYELTWKYCSILWWAVGVHLCCFIITKRELSTDANIISLVCIMSLAAFVVKKLLTERMAASHIDNNSETDAGCFILGILGIGSLILKLYPASTNAHCYGLVFVISFFHLLNPGVPYKMTKNYNFVCIINQTCIELIFTFCAMIIGYLLSYIIYYKTVPPGVSHIFSDVSLSVLATVMVLVSIRYSIKGDKSSPTTTAATTTTIKSNCVSPA
ncbi:hypothetical protein BsWGS_02838 [Bradybaena similaris]